MKLDTFKTARVEMSKPSDELATSQLSSTNGPNGLAALENAVQVSSDELDPAHALALKRKLLDVTTALAHSTNSGQPGLLAMLPAAKVSELDNEPADTVLLESTASVKHSNLLSALLSILASLSGLLGLPALLPATTASNPATELESALVKLTAKPSDASSILAIGLPGPHGLAALSLAAVVKLPDNESTLALAKLNSRKSAATPLQASISSGANGLLVLDLAPAVTSSELDNTPAAEKIKFKLSLADPWVFTPTGLNGHLAHDAMTSVRTPFLLSDNEATLALKSLNNKKRPALLLDVLTGLSGATGVSAQQVAVWDSENEFDDAWVTMLTA